jgi:hypothetical protein
VNFASNALSLPRIDAARAAEAHRVFERTLVAECAGAQQRPANGAKASYASLSAAAAQDALGGSAKK